MIVHVALVHQLAEEIVARAAARTVRFLTRLPGGLSGDDSGLHSVWEEYCVQIQGEESLYWDVYEYTVRECISGSMMHLSHLQKVAVWLQSDAADEWLGEHGDEGELPAIAEREVVDVVYREVWRLADESRNRRVVRYLERANGDDKCRC